MLSDCVSTEPSTSHTLHLVSQSFDNSWACHAENLWKSPHILKGFWGTWIAVESGHRHNVVPAVQIVLLQACTRLLLQLCFSPIQAEFCVAIVQWVALPAHDIHQVVRLIRLVEDAVQDAVLLSSCLGAPRAVGQPGREAVQNSAVAHATDSATLRQICSLGCKFLEFECFIEYWKSLPYW